MSTSVPELGKQLQEKISESSALEIEIHKLEEEIENVLLKGIENPTVYFKKIFQVYFKIFLFFFFLMEGSFKIR